MFMPELCKSNLTRTLKGEVEPSLDKNHGHFTGQSLDSKNNQKTVDLHPKQWIMTTQMVVYISEAVID
jgi:hypothetical protein